MTRVPRLSAVALAAVALAGLPLAAVAHGSIKFGDGAYQMELGFENEPAYLGQPNAIYVEVGKFGTGGLQPVNDLAGSLQAEVSKDGKTLAVPLVPKGDGVYVAPFFPTATGDYTFRVSGTVDGVAVDESMTSSPTTFDSVQPITAVEFPVASPDAAAVAQQAASAEAAAATARTLGIGGLALGALGTLLGLLGLTRGGRRRAAPEPAAAPHAMSADTPLIKH